MARDGQVRLDRARAAMERAGLDGLLLLNSTNLVYLSGYPAVERTLARPHYLVVPRRGDPTFLVHEGRLAEARRYGWIDEVRTYHALSVAPLAELHRVFTEGSHRVRARLRPADRHSLRRVRADPGRARPGAVRGRGTPALAPSDDQDADGSRRAPRGVPDHQ